MCDWQKKLYFSAETHTCIAGESKATTITSNLAKPQSK